MLSRIKLRALEALGCQPRRLVHRAFEEARKQTYTLLATNTLAFTPNRVIDAFGDALRVLQRRGKVIWWKIGSHEVSPHNYEIKVTCTFDWRGAHHEEYDFKIP